MISDSISTQPGSVCKTTNEERNEIATGSPNASINGFYRAFEERYRGSRDLIKGRLNIYLPFIGPLKEIYPDCKAIDLGCGRGEWLELLQNQDFNAHGVDLDEGMLSACDELGLSVIQTEAIGYLKSIAENSCCIISGFHFAEHIPFDDLRVLVAEALRVLRPGGLLILETPNPENIAVGTSSFYLDPTHKRPIPSLLMSFIAEYQGFARVKILGLQESFELFESKNLTLKNVLFGVSPDYAIVGQKKAEANIMKRFDSVFDKNYGISLQDLSDLYDTRIERRITSLDQRISTGESAWAGMSDALSRITTLQDRLIEATALSEAMKARAAIQEHFANTSDARAAEQEQRATHAEAHVQQVNARAQLAETQAQQANDRAQLAEIQAQQAEDIQRSTQQELANLHQANHQHWELAEERDHQIKALLNSVSWKITAPMRIVGSALIRLRGWRVKSPSPPRNISTATIRNAAVTPVIAIARYMQNSPYLRNIALRGLSYTPGLAIKLRRMYIESELKNNSFKDKGMGDLGAPSAGHSFSSHNPNPTNLDGINSCQRSPLEAYFHRYEKYK